MLQSLKFASPGGAHRQVRADPGPSPIDIDVPRVIIGAARRTCQREGPGLAAQTCAASGNCTGEDDVMSDVRATLPGSKAINALRPILHT